VSLPSRRFCCTGLTPCRRLVAFGGSLEARPPSSVGSVGRRAARLAPLPLASSSQRQKVALRRTISQSCLWLHSSATRIKINHRPQEAPASRVRDIGKLTAKIQPFPLCPGGYICEDRGSDAPDAPMDDARLDKPCSHDASSRIPASPAVKRRSVRQSHVRYLVGARHSERHRCQC
jgi:hypothetical protein